MKKTILLVILIIINFTVFGLSPKTALNDGKTSIPLIFGDTSYNYLVRSLINPNFLSIEQISEILKHNESFNFEISTPDYIKIGNIHSIIKSNDNPMSVILLWKSTPPLDENIHSKFMFFNESVLGLDNRYRKDFESLLTLLGVHFEKDSSGCFYFIEAASDLLKLEKLYKILNSFIEEVISNSSYKKDDLVAKIERLEYDVLMNFPSLKNDLFYIWYACASYLRSTLIGKNIPLDYQKAKNYEVIDNKNIFESSVYDRLTFIFSYFAKLSLLKKLPGDINPSWVLYQAPFERLFEYISLMHDWMNSRRSENINWFTSSAIYSNDLLYDYILSVKFNGVPFSDNKYAEFKLFYKNKFREYLGKYLDESSVYSSGSSADKNIAKAFDALGVNRNLIKVFIKHLHITINHLHQMDSSNHKRVIYGLRQEMKILYDSVLECQRIFEKAKVQFGKFKLLNKNNIKEKESLSDIEVKLSKLDKFWDERLRLRDLLKNIECMLVSFMAGEMTKNDIKNSFGGLLDEIGPNKFFNMRLFAPNRVIYNKNTTIKSEEKYKKDFINRVAFLESSLSALEDHGIYVRENRKKTYFNFLMPIDQRLFNCFYFWDFNYPIEKENAHINFLKDMVKTDVYNAHFASLMLMYYYLFQDAKNNKNENDYIDEKNIILAEFYFRSALDLIPNVVKAREEKLFYDDSGYIKDFSDSNVDLEKQELNRLISFFNIIFTENINSLKIPNTIIHKKNGTMSFVNEFYLLERILNHDFKQDDEIKWDRVIKMYEFIFSISMQPLEIELKNSFGKLFECKVPDEVLNKLLQSFFNENHKFSLIYASFIIEYISKDENLKPKYLLSYNSCNEMMDKKNNCSLNLVFHLIQYFISKNQHFEAGRLLSQVSGKMPKEFNEDSTSFEIFEKISKDADIDAFEPIFNLLKEVISIEGFLKDAIFQAIQNIIRSENIYFSSEDFIRILDEQPQNILEGDTYFNAPLHVRDRIQGVIEDLNEMKFVRKIAFYFLLNEFSNMDFDFKRTKKDPDNSQFNTFINNKFKVLEFIISTMNALRNDAVVSNSLQPSNVDIENSFKELNEILDYVRYLQRISDAFNNGNYFLASQILYEFKERFNFFDFSHQQQSKINKKAKKGKKQKQIVKQNGPKIISSFPNSFNEEVLIFLRNVQKYSSELNAEDLIHKEKLHDIAKRVCMFKIKSDEYPFFENLQSSISYIKELLIVKPYLFDINFFDVIKEPFLFEYYKKNYSNLKMDTFLLDLENFSYNLSILKVKTLTLFDKLKNRRKNDLSEIFQVFNLLKEIERIDKKTFEDTIIEIGFFLKNSYINIEVSILEHLAKSYDYEKNIFNHEVLSVSEYAKVESLHFISSEFLKWFHAEKYYDKYEEIFFPFERVEYLTHSALVIHILKINRLNLAVKNKVEKINREETQEAFRRQVKAINVNNGFENLRLFNREVTLTEKQDLYTLDLDALSDFMDKDTNSDKKNEKAKRIFKVGSRLIFFKIKDSDDFVSFSKEENLKSLPVFEITEIVKGEYGRSGKILFSLENKEDFPPKTTNIDILRNYFPTPQKGYKTFFLIKESYEIRDRYLFFNKILSELLIKPERKFLFDSSDRIELNRDFPNASILNSVLGLYSNYYKNAIERLNNEIIVNDLSLGEKIAYEKDQIFKKMQESSSENIGNKVDWVNAPGGTGKTYFAKYLIDYLIRQIKGFIFICTPTHRAVDKVIMDIVFSDVLKEKSLKDLVVRVANTEVKSKIVPLIRDDIWEKRGEILANIISNNLGLFFSTSTGFNGDALIREVRKKIIADTGKDIFCGEYIIYDEAGNDSYENFLYFLYKHSKENTKVLVLGDVLQLGPFGMSDQEKNEILTILSPYNLIKNFDGINLQKTLLSNFYQFALQTSPLQQFHGSFGFKRHFLTENRRSGKAIVEVLNETGYSAYAKNMTSKINEKVPFHEQVKFINVEQNRQNELKRGIDGKVIKGDHINFKEIQQLLIQLDKDFQDYQFLSGNDIAFISPYKAQNELFKLSIVAYAILLELSSIEKDDSIKLLDLSNRIKINLNNLNELISIYAGKDNILINSKFFEKTSLSFFDLNELKKHLFSNLPWFIPRYGKALTLNRISNLDTINIGNYSEDEGSLEENLSNIDITTIHKKQGGQSFAVYFSAVRRNREGNVGFMEDQNGPRMLHVAFGRAEQILRVAASLSTWKKLGLKAPQKNNLEDRIRMKYRSEASFIMTKAFQVARDIGLRDMNKSKVEEIKSNKINKKAS